MQTSPPSFSDRDSSDHETPVTSTLALLTKCNTMWAEASPHAKRVYEERAEEELKEKDRELIERIRSDESLSSEEGASGDEGRGGGSLSLREAAGLAGFVAAKHIDAATRGDEELDVGEFVGRLLGA
jgi:hypothetical protein